MKRVRHVAKEGKADFNRLLWQMDVQTSLIGRIESSLASFDLGRSSIFLDAPLVWELVCSRSSPTS